MRVLEALQRLHLERRVADDFKQLLMAPHIAFERRDVEIADDERRAINRIGPPRHAFEKIEFLAKLRVLLTVRNIAACGHIDILDHHVLADEFDAHMARFAIGLPVVARDFADRQAADGRNTVIAFLPAHRLMLIARRRQRLSRKQMLLALDFLQAEHIGRLVLEIFLDDRQAQAGRVDIPGGDRNHGR